MQLVQITLTVLCLCLLVAASSHAQDARVSTVEIDRGSDELSDAVRIRPDDIDRDFINTALIFTNTSMDPNTVSCVARNDNGVAIGRARTAVPRKGLRFIFASDFANGADFVGSVDCWTNGRIAATALLLGPTGVTDLPARRINYDDD